MHISNQYELVVSIYSAQSVIWIVFVWVCCLRTYSCRFGFCGWANHIECEWTVKTICVVYNIYILHTDIILVWAIQYIRQHECMHMHMYLCVVYGWVHRNTHTCTHRMSVHIRKKSTIYNKDIFIAFEPTSVLLFYISLFYILKL